MEDLHELNRFFHEETLRSLIDSYNTGSGSKYSFDFLDPGRFIHEDSGVNLSLISGIKSREIKGHSLPDVRFFLYETGTPSPYMCSILVVDTIARLARYYTLLGGNSGCNVYYNGNSDAFIAEEVADRNQFEKCIIETTKVEQKFRSLHNSSSTLLISSLPRKRLTDVFPINFQEKLKKLTTDWEIHFAKSLKQYFNPTFGNNLLTQIFVDHSGFFYILPVGGCIVVICRKGFKDGSTLRKLGWMYGLPIFQDPRMRTDAFVFIDPLSNQHEFLDVREIDLPKL